MKLNLGCGSDVRDGFLNVDFRKTHPDVHVVDLSRLPWPWTNGSIDEILMLDFLEHFPYAQTIPILFECYRILNDDGTVVVQVPDAEQLAHVLVDDGQYFCNDCGHFMDMGNENGSCVDCPKCGNSSIDMAEAAMRRLYGGQDYPGNFHQTCFTRRMLVQKAAQIGLELVSDEEVTHQSLNWNFKMRFKRGSVW